MRALISAVIILSIFLFFAGCGKRTGPEPSLEIQFTAVLKMSDAGGTTESRVWFTRDMQRVEMLPPARGTVIIRMDKGVVWLIMTNEKKYAEVAIRPEHRNPLIYQPKEITEWEEVDKETVDGHPAIKERLTMDNGDGNRMDIYRWFASDIRWPVKAEAVDGSWSLEYRDLKTGPQDKSMFEVPDGFIRIGKM